jgi:cytochrome c
MKLKVMMLVAAGALLSVGAASAQDADALMKSKCAACHDVDKKKMGPSYKESAAKYANDADAVAKLVKKLKDGEDKHPKVALTDDELKAVVTSTLSHK